MLILRSARSVCGNGAQARTPSTKAKDPLWQPSPITDLWEAVAEVTLDDNSTVNLSAETGEPGPIRQRREGFCPVLFGLKGRFCQFPRPKAWETCPVFFGLKGRFCQPRPKAWESASHAGFDPERGVHHRPFCGRTALTGPMPGHAAFRGLRPELTETALQAEKILHGVARQSPGSAMRNAAAYAARLANFSLLRGEPEKVCKKLIL